MNQAGPEGVEFANRIWWAPWIEWMVGLVQCFRTGSTPGGTP